MRNLEYRFSIKWVIAAAILVAVLGTGELSAGPNRSSLLSQKNAAANAQQQQQQQPMRPNFGTPTPELFRERLDQAIDVTSRRYMSADSHSPWQIFHGVLALKQDCQLRLGKEKVNAIEWLSTTEPHFNKEPWMSLTPHGAKFHPYSVKYYFEGHPGQFLALLSESDLPLDHKIKVDGKVVTLNDVVNNTMKEVNSREEVTWVLWALQHYLKSDAVWTNQANESWSIERLVQIETAQPVVGAPCGGNHRLFALTRARDKHLQALPAGARLRGVWLEADQKINKHIEIARSLQNRDGSFSSDSYKGPGNTNDINERFNTTGHTMEFLSISLPKERLNEAWVRSAVWMLSNELVYFQNNEISAGPLFHTLDALILYRDRIRQSGSNESAPRPQATAQSPGNSASKNIPPLNATPEKSLIAEETSKGSKSGPDSASPEVLPLPNDDGLIVPDAKIAGSNPNAIKFSRPRIVNPETDSMARRGTGSKSSPKLDPSRLTEVGEPAPAVNGKSPASRIGDPNSAPKLLPETFSRPLIVQDGSAKDDDDEARLPVWRPTSPDRLSQAPSTESKAIPEESRTASALEPSNIR